jgi:hypothetical protein
MEPYANATKARHLEGMDEKKRGSFLNQRVMLRLNLPQRPKVESMHAILHNSSNKQVCPLYYAVLSGFGSEIKKKENRLH